MGEMFRVPLFSYDFLLDDVVGELKREGILMTNQEFYYFQP